MVDVEDNFPAVEPQETNMPLVTLKNGQVEFKKDVERYREKITKLRDSDPKLFYYFLQRCHNPTHTLTIQQSVTLLHKGLIDDDGVVNGVCRATALSMTDGSGRSVELSSPYQDDAPESNKES